MRPRSALMWESFSRSCANWRFCKKMFFIYSEMLPADELI